MNNHSEAGKGDKQRPTDVQRYAANYDKIFGTKTHSKTTQHPTAPTVDIGVKINAKK